MITDNGKSVAPTSSLEGIGQINSHSSDKDRIWGVILKKKKKKKGAICKL